GKHLIGMKNLRAHRWIGVDEGGCTLSLKAKVKSAESPIQVDVQVVSAEGSGNVSRQGVVAEGTMILADEYPTAPPCMPFICYQERPYSLRTEQYYDAMFHGPSF